MLSCSSGNEENNCTSNVILSDACAVNANLTYLVDDYDMICASSNSLCRRGRSNLGGDEIASEGQSHCMKSNKAIYAHWDLSIEAIYRYKANCPSASNGGLSGTCLNWKHCISFFED